jgi:hypothetical protein
MTLCAIYDFEVMNFHSVNPLTNGSNYALNAFVSFSLSLSLFYHTVLSISIMIYLYIFFTTGYLYH